MQRNILRSLTTIMIVMGGAGFFGQVVAEAVNIKADNEKQQLLSQQPFTVQKTFDAAAFERYLTELQPSREQSIAARDLARQVDYYHYLGKPIDEAMSAKVLDFYIDSLDADHTLFLQSEIDALRAKYSKDFAIRLKRGDLSAGFEIFKLAQQASLRYLTTAEQYVRSKPALETNRTISTDREKAPFFQTQVEQTQYWQDSVLSQLIALTAAEQLNPKNNEDGDATKELIVGVKNKLDLSPDETLLKRFDRQRERMLRTKNDQVTEVVLNALLGSYDPHSTYFAPIEAMEFNRQSNLQLEGIGVSIRPVSGNEDYTRIETIVPGGPSAKSGLVNAGDIILGVAQENEKMVDVVGWPVSEIVGLIRGSRGTKVTLRLVATGSSLSQARNVTITRDIIQEKESGVQTRTVSVTRGNKTFNVGIIDIPSFYLNFKAKREGSSYRSVSEDTYQAIQTLSAQGVDGIVVDLRNNPGGSLEEVNRMIGMFITEGPVVQIRQGNGDVRVFQDGDGGRIDYRGPMTVLINAGSASASEIFSAAMQDYNRALIMGSTTLGKGTAQRQLEDLAYGQATLTQSKFYRVTGGSTQNKGVEPDIALVNIYGNGMRESKLKNPLEWDTIRTAAFTAQSNVSEAMPALQERSKQRVAQNVQFNYLEKVTVLRFKDEDKKQVKLSLSSRLEDIKQNQQALLDAENERRRQTGQTPYVSWQVMQKANEKESEARAKLEEKDRPKLPEDEAFILEGAASVVDQIETKVGAVQLN